MPQYIWQGIYGQNPNTSADGPNAPRVTIHCRLGESWGGGGGGLGFRTRPPPPPRPAGPVSNKGWPGSAHNNGGADKWPLLSKSAPVRWEMFVFEKQTQTI